MPQDSSSNQVALITGSAKRIGKEIAQHLHKQNYNIIVHYNTSKFDAKELVNEFNSNRQNSAMAIQADLSFLKEIKNLAQSALNYKGKINLLVNNASLFTPNNIQDTSIGEWNNLFESTSKGCYFLTQYLIPTLSRHQGNVINILDTHYQSPRNGFSLYSMAKASLAMQTKCFALELAPKVRVNGIALGHFKWPEYKDYDVRIEEELLNKIPLSKSGNANDINYTIDFITQNNYLTGEIIHLDGGKRISPLI
jgi:pteridine reductase